MDSKQDSDDTFEETMRQFFVSRKSASRFERAYGRLMIAWADTEAELYKTLVHYAGVTDAIARAIFSGTRAGVMMDYIHGIAANTKLSGDRLTDINYVFPQISAINKMRDHLAHHASGSYSWNPKNPEQRVVTNAERISRYGNEKVTLIGFDTLDNMTKDLHDISNHLNMHHGRLRIGEFRVWHRAGEDSPYPTWLYKSPQPIKPKNKNPSSPHKRAGPRPSSAQRREQALKK